MRWVWLGLAICCEVTGTLALRATVDHLAWVGLVVVGYSAAFVFMAATLRLGTPVGVTYGIWAATGVCLTAVFAVLIFGDQLTTTTGIGIAVVIAGVLLVEFGSREVPQHSNERQQS
jgi:small multidrug resistance pump